MTEYDLEGLTAIEIPAILKTTHISSSIKDIMRYAWNSSWKNQFFIPKRITLTTLSAGPKSALPTFLPMFTTGWNYT